MKNTTNILIVDTLYWDRFLRREFHPNDVLYGALAKDGRWEGHGDKADLNPAEYTIVNQVVDKLPEVFDQIANIGGTGANIFMTAAEGLKGTGNDLGLIFFSAVSTDTSGNHIRQVLSRYPNVELFDPFDPARRSEIQSPTSFHFSLGGIKRTAKGPGQGNELFKPEHAHEVFEGEGRPRIHRVFIPGNVVGRFDMETIYTLLNLAEKHECQIIFAPPTKFNAENRRFTDLMLNEYASEFVSNMEEACETFRVNNDEGGRQYAISQALKMVSTRMHLKPSIAISDSIRGTYFGLPEAGIIHTPVWNHETILVDNTGAGDNGVAGREIGLNRGWDRPETIGACGYIGGALSDECLRHPGAQITTRPIQEIVDEAITRFGHVQLQKAMEKPEISRESYFEGTLTNKSNPPRLHEARIRNNGQIHE